MKQNEVAYSNPKAETEDDGHGGGPQGSASAFTALLNLFKSLVGIGVLALPTAFKNSGWVGGLVLLPICAAAMLYVSDQIIDIADNINTKAKNIIEFVKETIPLAFLSSINACLFLFQIGICISYVIFFIQYIQQTFCNIDGSMFPCSSKLISVLVSLTILIPLVMIRDMNKLKPWSLMGNIVTVVSLIIVSIYCVIYYATGEESDTQTEALNISEIGNSIGVFIFTFEGTGVYFNIRYSMVEPKKFKKVLNIAIFSGITIYCLVGFVGYMAFGNGVNDIILFSFSDDVIPVQVIKVCYCIALIFTYPIQIFPCVSVAESKLKKMIYKTVPDTIRHNPDMNHSENDSSALLSGDQMVDSFNLEKLNKKFFLYSVGVRLGFVIITFAVGIFFDRVSDFISLTGDVCGIYLCYVVPVLVIQYQDKEIKPVRKYLNYFIVLVSIGFGIYGLYSTIIQIGKDFF